MNVLFMMMMKSDLLKIMVSVFKTSAIAMKFFKDELKYELDETSPDEAAGEEAGQTWRFYPGGLNVKCRHVIFSISSEGGDRIKERLFAGSIRRRRRSETMRELRPWPAAPPVNVRRAGGG